MAGPHAHTLIRDCCNKLYVHSGSGDRGQSSVCREKTYQQHVSAMSWCWHTGSQGTASGVGAAPWWTSARITRPNSPFIQFVLHGFALPVTGDNLDLVHLHQVGHLSELHIVQDERPHVVTEPVGVERTLRDRRTHAQLEELPEIKYVQSLFINLLLMRWQTSDWLLSEHTQRQDRGDVNKRGKFGQ